MPDWKIKNRCAATWSALNFLGKADDWWDPKLMIEFATQAFEAVKAGIEVRSTKKMAKRLTDECLDEIRAEIKKLAKRGEVHVLDKLEITEIQLVHFEAPASKTRHTFTALISAVSRNFYKDEKTGEVLRGDKKVYETQEFWRFRRAKDFWLVKRIREAGDMDMVLEHKNVMTPKDMAAFSKKADEAHLREFAEKSGGAEGTPMDLVSWLVWDYVHDRQIADMHDRLRPDADAEGPGPVGRAELDGPGPREPGAEAAARPPGAVAHR